MKIAIHGHPQKQFYDGDDPRQRTKVSCQSHWRDTPREGDLTAHNVKHTHVDLFPFLYQEVDDLIVVPFAIVLHHTDGFATVNLDRQETVVKVDWDDIGVQTDTERKLPGNPDGDATWTGHLTYDPRRNVGGHGFPLRGWYSPQFEVGTTYPNGVEILQLVKIPFYSMLDPAAPDGSLSGVPTIISSSYPHSPRIKEWGTNYVETGAFLPLAPITQPWRLWMGTAAYGGNEIGDGLFEQRVDLDLHNGIPGRLLSHQPESGFTSADRAPILDPAVIGLGAHKMAFIWSKPTRDDSEEVSALLVVTVDVASVSTPGVTIIPNLVGLQANAASGALATAQLTVGSITTQASTLPAGQVLSQSPIAGTSVPVGSAVNFVKAIADMPQPVDDWHTIGTIASPEGPAIQLQQFGKGPRRRYCTDGRCVELL